MFLLNMIRSLNTTAKEIIAEHKPIQELHTTLLELYLTNVFFL